ncbi:MAG: hypothetical protein DDT29_00706 [Dehalococcoidia bacterium]|nr:hypothetical protein [Bacillota bacterium]
MGSKIDSSFGNWFYSPAHQLYIVISGDGPNYKIMTSPDRINWTPCAPATETEEKEICEMKPHDPVNRPSHYTAGKIEVIDFIDDQRLTYCLGNAVKYITRAGKKDPNKTVEDLQKAAWYLNHETERLEKGSI